ncbi:ABC transporter substrate-binding protein [Lacibacter sediminis]|uniref:ABC transporter substrate-binding protein n=1 Tax=Lacibacter sediminis TaxID=2760713 RepID=A0A7G5XBE1_9BACT|nr:helical backbone metal receptor [Lacibacter sediminis]QNA42794.1 ABC transporter substrate-binding protein [Lacibacter sediminis]
MKQVQDQTGNFVSIPFPSQRVISLVPSLTELLFDLGLTDEVVGITKFCVHPEEWFRSKTRIGGTKQVNLPLIESLKPDLVIASKEENIKEQVEAVQQFCPVYCSDISNLQESYEVIEHLGFLTDRIDKANQLINNIQNIFKGLSVCSKPIRAAYLIWQEPYMTVGGDTFISHMMELAGFENVFVTEQRYPVLTIEELMKRDVEAVLFSSEPFPFKQKHLDAFKQTWLRQSSIGQLPVCKIVDGELFSWYGSRTLYATDYFIKLRESLFLSDELTA